MAPDRAKVYCIRVMEGCEKKHGKPIEAKGGMGWLHKLADAAPNPIKVIRPAKPKPKLTIDQCVAMQVQFAAAAGDAYVTRFADELGVQAASLHRLGIGWCAKRACWTFPMRDASAAIVGFRTRRADAKRSIPGGRNGLFIPHFFRASDPVCIAEGPTDTAAMLTLGFECIGRSHCTGNVPEIVELLRGYRGSVWIMADGDEAGVEGAIRLAEHLSQRVKILTPGQHKDIRAWVKAGATREMVLSMARNARYWLQRGVAA